MLCSFIIQNYKKSRLTTLTFWAKQIILLKGKITSFIGGVGIKRKNQSKRNTQIRTRHETCAGGAKNQIMLRYNKIPSQPEVLTGKNLMESW
jgi:hypothetical protein